LKRLKSKSEVSGAASILQLSISRAQSLMATSMGEIFSTGGFQALCLALQTGGTYVWTQRYHYRSFRSFLPSDAQERGGERTG
jgi:hypothetical protein